VSKPNRLASAVSPYLLQHAHNPVDWWPWGPEAIAEARRRDVPIFLSIGYSTCYWCHVMERESFEDETTARMMNESFVCVKLDREERPDLDEAYMAATVMMNGHGGWPMSVFLEPDTLRPFFCGTYYPKHDRHGLPSFTRVLEALGKGYRAKRGEVREQAAALAAAVAEDLSAQPALAPLGVEHLELATQRILAMSDGVHGGFGTAPKFPQPVFVEFLLDVRPRVDEATKLAIDRAVRGALDGMAMGGIHDHVGGGFHRYSVDGHWTVPHFEKMLYDQAQLLSVYSRVARLYGDAWYRKVAERTARFVRSSFTDADGGFFSALDAEVDGREGLNYLWTPDEVNAALPAADAEFAVRVFGLDREANFQDPHHPDAPPAWVLRLSARPEKVAEQLGKTPEAFDDTFTIVTERLAAARARRKQPRLDDKALAAWNGLMIAALVDAGEAQPAARAASLLMERLRAKGKTLRRVARGKTAQTDAVLEDYAAMITALVRVGENTLARSLYGEARGLFFDDATGAIFDSPKGAQDLFVRTCATHDGAIPSGFSMMLHAMLDLAQATGDREIAREAVRSLAFQSGRVAASPVGCVNSVRALLRVLVDAELRAELERLLAGATPIGGASTTATSAQPALPDPVQVYASVERITVRKDAPAEVTLRVVVANGAHVIAGVQDEGAPAGLTPLRVSVTNGKGVAAYADYPEGELLPDVNARVNHGEFDLRVALERDGEWSGNPILTLTYQACDDRACLPPRTVEIDVSIDRA
jgi:uncharacterized protein